MSISVVLGHVIVLSFLVSSRLCASMCSCLLVMDRFWSCVVMLYLYLLLLFFFFFFQAEDGIRDIGVTGVQTCALPICRPPRSRGGRPAACGDGTPGRAGAGSARPPRTRHGGPGGRRPSPRSRCRRDSGRRRRGGRRGSPRRRGRTRRRGGRAAPPCGCPVRRRGRAAAGRPPSVSSSAPRRPCPRTPPSGPPCARPSPRDRSTACRSRSSGERTSASLLVGARWPPRARKLPPRRPPHAPPAHRPRARARLRPLGTQGWR